MFRLVGLLVVFAPAVASAHIALTNPPARTTEQKVGPCGASGSVRSTKVTVLEPGAPLEVRWTEPINHPSHYRISLDVDGQDFTVPLDFRDFSQTENVVADDISDGASPYARTIELPDVPCERCTLQLIQVMYDKAPYGDGNDIYFQCADIALRPGGGDDVDEGTAPGAVGGCSAGGGHLSVPLIVALLVPCCRRRRVARFT